MNPARLLHLGCAALESGTEASAKSLLAKFPPLPGAAARSHWSKRRLTAIFRRDRFTDRYSGQPLVFPAELRTLSILMPADFPYHPNWRQASPHPAYWLLYPTIDHIVPLARGGLDTEDNVVAISMLRNAQKANWLLEEFGWQTGLAPCLMDWGGLLPWFVRRLEMEADLRQSAVMHARYRTTEAG